MSGYGAALRDTEKQEFLVLIFSENVCLSSYVILEISTDPLKLK